MRNTKKLRAVLCTYVLVSRRLCRYLGVFMGFHSMQILENGVLVSHENVPPTHATPVLSLLFRYLMLTFKSKPGEINLAAY